MLTEALHRIDAAARAVDEAMRTAPPTLASRWRGWLEGDWLPFRERFADETNGSARLAALLYPGAIQGEIARYTREVQAFAIAIRGTASAAGGRAERSTDPPILRAEDAPAATASPWLVFLGGAIVAGVAYLAWSKLGDARRHLALGRDLASKAGAGAAPALPPAPRFDGSDLLSGPLPLDRSTLEMRTASTADLLAFVEADGVDGWPRRQVVDHAIPVLASSQVPAVAIARPLRYI